MKNKILIGIALLGSAFFISKIIEKGGEEMDVVYATLIINGYKTFSQVPKVIKPRVKTVLENLGFPELAVEE